MYVECEIIVRAGYYESDGGGFLARISVSSICHSCFSGVLVSCVFVHMAPC